MPNLYHDTAEPAAAVPALEGGRQTDVLIVGAGFTGLSTALSLAERGAGAVVLETHDPGWGASGATADKSMPDSKPIRTPWSGISAPISALECRRLRERRRPTFSI